MRELGVGLHRGEEVVHEARLQGRLAAGHRDAGQEAVQPADVGQHLLDGHHPGPRCGERDRVRVVAGGAVEVAALQEHHVAVARPVDPAERDDVSEQAQRRTHR